MKRIFFLLIITFGLTALSNAQTKDIDVIRHNKAIKILNEQDKKLKQQTVDNVLKNPNFYNPPVYLCTLTGALQSGQKRRSNILVLCSTTTSKI